MSEASERLRFLVDTLGSEEFATRIQTLGANSMSAKVKRRVFRDGIATDESQIGSYSTKPAYFGPVLGVPKIKPQGKTGKTKKADGTPYKTSYFEDGYKGFRSHVGRQNEKVDLNLSGAAFKGVGVGVTGDGRIGFGILTDDAARKIEANEDRFKVALTPTENEVRAVHDEMTEEILSILLPK